MDKIGTSASDKLLGTDENDFLSGEGNNDTLAGQGGHDTILGGTGDDNIDGEGGDDLLFGNSSAGGDIDLEKFRISQDVTATVTFLGETAGYRNVLGVYKIADDGTVYDVEVLFENASLKGSGGSLVGGESSVELELSEGDQLGFFVVPNGYSQRGMKDVLTTENVTYKLVDSNGDPANATSGESMTLVQVDAEGNETPIKSQYGTEIFHSVTEPNSDDIAHAHASVDTQSGTVKIGFEDLLGGGDNDFDDSIFQIDIGVTNAALLPRPAGDTDGPRTTDDDTIFGGTGADTIFGMRGDDHVEGGDDNDLIYGNSGNDDLFGGDGNDDIRGGSGNDTIDGGADADVIDGNTGDDIIDGGDGNDQIKGSSGNDTITAGAGDDVTYGGSGDDLLFAGLGDDFYDGDSGFDTIDYSSSEQGLTVDLSKHTITGNGDDEVWSIEGLVASDHDDTIKADKRDNVIDGGAGDDEIRGLGGADDLTGGAGADTFVWQTKDIIVDGNSLGVDTIADFSFDDGDVLDLSKVVEGSPDSVADVVFLTENDTGTLVSVALGDKVVDVVQLEGISGVTADGLLADGYLLV
ncbi:MAG: calcium-binding protein [Pseudomonadota bacterium]